MSFRYNFDLRWSQHELNTTKAPNEKSMHHRLIALQWSRMVARFSCSVPLFSGHSDLLLLQATFVRWKVTRRYVPETLWNFFLWSDDTWSLIILHSTITKLPLIYISYLYHDMIMLTSNACYYQTFIKYSLFRPTE